MNNNIRLDFRHTPLAVGQTVAYFDKDDRRLYEAQIQMLTDEQAVIGSGTSVTVVPGKFYPPGIGSSDPATVRFMTLVVLPDAAPTEEPTP